MNRLLFPLLALLPQMAPAQDVAGCAALWDLLEQQIGTSLTGLGPVIDAEGWCAMSDVEAGDGSYYTPVWEVELLRWRGTGIDRFIADLHPPTALDVQMRGLRQFIQTGEPLTDYLTRLQQRDYIDAVDVSLVWDASTQVLDIARFDVDFSGDNGLSVSGQIAGLDLTSLQTAEMTAMAAGITSLTVEVTSNGLFENVMAMPLGLAFLDYDRDPVAQVKELRALTHAQIARLPDALMAAESRAALNLLVDELPTPAGTLRVQIDAPGRLAPARFIGSALFGVPETPEALWALLDDVTVTVNYPQVAE